MGQGASPVPGAGTGAGGIGRGPGAAPLTFGPAMNPFEGEAFSAQRLTPAEFGAIDRSTLIGISATAPQVSDVAGEATGDAGAATSVGASTWRRRLEPRHRRAVSSFFESKRD